jgi:hypothetical protein
MYQITYQATYSRIPVYDSFLKYLDVGNLDCDDLLCISNREKDFKRKIVISVYLKQA